eukprot:g8330.t1
MNITRENFEATFETICEAIRTSHFIALDAEFSGLRLPGAAKERMMDSVQKRYDLARDSCSHFMLMQYGICCFRYIDGDEDDCPGQLEARPFNCFVVPSTKFGSDRVYSCQASSMDFLSNHGFDFQAWAAHGVPYLSRAEEEVAKDKLKARWEREAAAAAKKQQAAVEAATAAPAAAGDEGPPDKPPVHMALDGTTIESLEEPEKGMVKDALSKVKTLLAESCGGDKYVETSVELDPMNGRQRWLMHEFVGSSTSDIKLCSLPGPTHARPMEIRTVCKDPEQQAKAEAKLRAEDETRQLNDLRKAVGFRRVVEEIFTAGKPVICHNGLLDLLHTHDKFVGPIPDDLDAGTKALHSLMPRLFDSKAVMGKAIAEGMRFPRTVLGEAHQWLRATFPAPPPASSPPRTNGEAEEEAAEQATHEPAAGPEVEWNAGSGEGANGGSVTNGENKGGGLEAGTEGGEEVADGEASAGAAAAAVAAATERTRKAWDAVFARGFEERYKGGGQEHEAAYDAYLTGCCFAAAATVGLGVGLGELKGMAGGGETPARLAPVMNVVPLHRVFGGQQICLPGPAPPLDLSRYVHVGGVPSAVRTDAIMTPIKAVGGCEEAWFHWIDDTSGVAECKTAQGAAALLEAAAAAAAAAAATAAVGGVSESTPRVIDRSRLLLEDLTLTQMDHALLAGSGTPGEAQEGSMEEGERKRAKRPRQEDPKEAEVPA